MTAYLLTVSLILSTYASRLNKPIKNMCCSEPFQQLIPSQGELLGWAEFLLWKSSEAEEALHLGDWFLLIQYLPQNQNWLQTVASGLGTKQVCHCYEDHFQQQFEFFLQQFALSPIFLATNCFKGNGYQSLRAGYMYCADDDGSVFSRKLLPDVNGPCGGILLKYCTLD